MKRTLVALTVAVGASACAAAPKPQVTPAPIVVPVARPPSPPFEVKQSWILRLEDQRILRVPPPPTPEAIVEPVGSATPAQTATAPPAVDLLQLLGDDEARVRRRAALAVGRVGLREGVAPLVALLKDRDPEVRQMAAYALGLIADASARDPLIEALGDESLLVKGSAAEALGLIGDVMSAEPVAHLAAEMLQTGTITEASFIDTTETAADASRNSPGGAFRLAIFALVRLKAYPALAGVVLDEGGQPRLSVWPVAFALQRLEDARALQALRTLARDSNPTTRAFAVKGLGSLKDRESVAQIASLVTSGDRASAIEAVRALGRIGDRAALPAVLKLVLAPKSDPFLKVEAVTALGLLGGDGTFDVLLDMLVDPNPPVRAAALRSLAQVDSTAFLAILAGLDPDPHFSVTSALASVLGTLPAESAMPRLRVMLQDPDARVVPPVLEAIAKLGAPDAAAIAIERLKVDDVFVRAAAAAAVGELKPAGGVEALADAYRRGASDHEYVARAAALAAAVACGPNESRPLLTTALADTDWAVRVRAAAFLKQIDPSSDVSERIRPAPTAVTAETYAAERLVSPRFSTEAYIETDHGLIRIELAVLDAPITVENFVTLANRGFFNGLTFHRVVPDFVVQAGDPRADSEGGPGYTIRDELNQRPFLRGTVGMALDWADTGGSQFFIAHSPQPHLDDRYTVFGRVLSGMDVVDQIQQGDVIRQIKILDGN